MGVDCFSIFIFISFFFFQQDSSLVLLVILPLGFIFMTFWCVCLFLATLPLQQPPVKHPYLPFVIGSLANSSFWN